MRNRKIMLIYCLILLILSSSLIGCSNKNESRAKDNALNRKVSTLETLQPSSTPKISDSNNMKEASNFEVADANVEIFCKVELKDTEIDALKMKLENHKSVSAYKLVTKEEQAKKAGKLLGSEKIFEGENASILPVSFVVKLKDASLVDDFYNEFKTDSRIDKVLKNNKENRSK